MSRVLSIEIGYTLTSVCEIDYKAKSPKVYKRFTVPTLAGVFNSDDVIVTDPYYTEGLRSAIRENNVKAKQIVFSISSSKIATREVMIPFVKENRIGDVVKANAGEYFPLDLSQYGLAYSVQEIVGEKGNEQQYKLLVMAVPKTIMQGYYDLAEAIKMSVVAFDYVGNSLFQVVRKECEEGMKLVAKIDGQSTLVSVMNNQKVVLMRNVPRGVEEALQVVMNSTVWGVSKSIRQTIDIVEKNNCIDLEMQEENVEEDIEDFGSEESVVKANVTDALVPLIRGIARVVDYYVSRNPEMPIEGVLITGIGASFLGIDDLIQKEINYPVNIIKEIEDLNLGKKFKDGFLGGYLSCIGAVIAPVEFVSEKEDKKGSIEVLPSKKGMIAVCVLVFVGGVLIAAALAGTSIYGYMQAVDENNSLNTRIEELAEAETIYQQYLQQLYSFNKLNYFQYSTIKPNEELVAFIDEMEQKMPSSLNVQSFNATESGVTMSLTVSDKEDAAMLIKQFRTFDTVDDVVVNSINDSGAVMDGQVLETEPMVSFSVTVVYKGGDIAAILEELARQETTVLSEEE